MTLYKVEIQTPKEGQVTSSIASYTDEKAAEMAFHDAVSYNLKLDTLKSFLVEILTETGVVVPNMQRFYNFEIPTPEPEPEEEPVE